MDESCCMTNTAFYVGMLSPAYSSAQSCMQSSIEAMRCWAQHLRPDSVVWPVHRYRVRPCQALQKYPCTVQSIGGLRHSAQAPPMLSTCSTTCKRHQPCHLHDYHLFTTVADEHRRPPEYPYCTAGGTVVDIAIQD